MTQPLFLGKKHGRPLKKGDKEWQDDEVLIELWAKHECLHNSKHLLYMNKTLRAKAMDGIIEVLKEENVETNDKEVQDKLTKLRVQSDAREEGSKVSRSGTDSLYISSWRFYASLHFLKDTLTPRATVSNID